MMTDSPSNIAILVRDIGKLYHLYNNPQDRLKNMLFWRFGRHYGADFWALRHLTFDLKRGEMLGVIGKNGSGKSTLLQMIAGTLNPTEGHIQCFGRVGALLELGSGFNPEYTGRENIYTNASILGLNPNEIKSQIEEIINFADIGEFIDQPVKVYSSGMFVRLAFAVTTGLRSEILLIDEALAVGDVFFRQKCYARLEELRKKGVSIILVTHGLGDVEQYCERAILLHHGQELFQGPAPEAVKRYYLVEQEERLGQAIPVSQTHNDPVEIDRATSAPVEDSVWPTPDAFFDLSHTPQVSNGWARCTGVALCDEVGQPCRVFEQGQIANFYSEFELLKDIEVPIGGLQIMNDKGLIIHGKTTLEYGTQSPIQVSKGDRVQFRHTISIEIAPGEYSFEVGFSTVGIVPFNEKDVLPFTDLYSNVLRICTLNGIGPFMVSFRKKYTPTQLLHHGLANLPGNCQITVARF